MIIPRAQSNGRIVEPKLADTKIRYIGKIDYQECWQDMKQFTATRTAETQDELWLVEHEPVFTLGLAGKEEHILIKDHHIPIIHCDRGGQVTYHGPQQIVIYLLLDLKRRSLTIRELVTRIENGVITFLAKHGIIAIGDRAAPGVYVNGQKIASLGLKISKGCTYHGLSFNFAMDPTPFTFINPCGYAGLKVVNFADLVPDMRQEQFAQISQLLASNLINSINN